MLNEQLSSHDLKAFKKILFNLESFDYLRDVKVILALLDASKLNIDLLRGTLLRLMAKADAGESNAENDALYAAVYSFLLLLAKYYPTNERSESGVVLCCFSQEPISPYSRMLSSSGAQFDGRFGEQAEGSNELRMYDYLKEQRVLPVPLINSNTEKAYLEHRANVLLNRRSTPEISVPIDVPKKNFWEYFTSFECLFKLGGPSFPTPKSTGGWIKNNFKYGSALGAPLTFWGGGASSLIIMLVGVIMATVATGGVVVPMALVTWGAVSLVSSFLLGIPVGGLIGGIVGGLLGIPRALWAAIRGENKERDPAVLVNRFFPQASEIPVRREKDTYVQLLNADSRIHNENEEGLPIRKIMQQSPVPVAEEPLSTVDMALRLSLPFRLR